ncbi:MAG TPA: hypothetical protein VLV85_17330 [Stellaceae bacterium]|jgi:hypothetical protein|nr:hypothetical protein [Stellaceae bacterium]
MSDIRVTRKPVPSPVQRAWLRRGLDQPGGKLPLFDRQGQQIDPRTIQACIEQGWAEPWFKNPIKPDWLICKLTEAGRKVATPRQPRSAPIAATVVELDRAKL